ncbi:MAG: hypothetical protein ACREND_00490 [Gemmatimonadaceae bacterium]
MSDLTGPGVTCTATGTTIHLLTSSTGFTGTYSGGEYTCTDGCASTTLEVGSGQVVNGNVARDLVVFDLGAPGNTFNGQVTADSMSGTVTISVGRPVGGPITLTGNWSATRPTG